MRKSNTFLIDERFITKALHYSNKESHALYLNPNDYNYPYGAFEHILAFGEIDTISGTGKDDFEHLKSFLNKHKDWAFGYFSYDLKNQIEALPTTVENLVGFPLLNFFIPESIIIFKNDSVEIKSFQEPSVLFGLINQEPYEVSKPANVAPFQPRISKAEYLSNIHDLQAQIAKGALYETNFCQEYFSENCTIKPLETYKRLNAISPMPFSTFLKSDFRHLICASPERFLKKVKTKLISQPIKGTAGRGTTDEIDEANKATLSNSEKEKSENIMIVDLVRNDLSKHALPGTVKVEELCKLYTFPNVHQLISTITADIEPTVHPIDIIRDAFPMGSMTGAPKVQAMKLIDQYEATSRGLFSGAVGYFTPELDFDFNVVIRSILYNEKNKYLSFQVGSAITAMSDAEKEYEECEVKISSIRKTLMGLE